MTPGFQTSGWINRYAATNPGISSLADDASLASTGELQIFNLNDFPHGSRIVHFGNADICRGNSRELICATSRMYRAMIFRLVLGSISSSPHHRRQNTNGARSRCPETPQSLACDQDCCRGSIRHRGAHWQREWVCDRWSGQDLLHCEPFLELCKWIVD